jgi:hypothetical protein
MLSLTCISYSASAQDSTAVKLNDKAKALLVKLEQQLDSIEKEEKAKLKDIISKLNAQQAKDSLYSAEDFKAMKLKNAERIAENIRNRQAIVQNQIDFLKRNGYLSDELKPRDGLDGEDGSFSVLGIDLVVTNADKKKTKRSITEREMFVAFGLNNAIPGDGGINDSPFKIGGSRFFEIGYQWSTRLTENNFMRLNYGLSFQFNGLKPNDDLIYVEDGNQTVLQPYEVDGTPISFDKNKFRQDNLIFPVHLQFNTTAYDYKDGSRYHNDRFNFGLGGFVGINLNNIQKLKFDAPNGDDEKLKFKDDYNTNNFLYGLSAYAGFGDKTIYLTYNLNTIFKDNPVSLNNVQLGLRWML